MGEHHARTSSKAGCVQATSLAKTPTATSIPSGRLKDTINRGGEKFGPIEVEDAIRTHPAVSDVAVAGIADEEMGQRVGAAVVARSPVTLEELRSHCRELIAYFKLPERLDDRRPHPLQRHRQGQPQSARRADCGRGLSQREESPCCFFTRPTRWSARARTSSRPPTARAGCPRWPKEMTRDFSGIPTTLTVPGCPTTSSPSPGSPMARRGNVWPAGSSRGICSRGCANWTTCATR